MNRSTVKSENYKYDVTWCLLTEQLTESFFQCLFIDFFQWNDNLLKSTFTMLLCKVPFILNPGLNLMKRAHAETGLLLDTPPFSLTTPESLWGQRKQHPIEFLATQPFTTVSSSISLVSNLDIMQLKKWQCITTRKIRFKKRSFSSV